MMKCSCGNEVVHTAQVGQSNALQPKKKVLRDEENTLQHRDNDTAVQQERKEMLADQDEMGRISHGTAKSAHT